MIVDGAIHDGKPAVIAPSSQYPTPGPSAPRSASNPAPAKHNPALSLPNLFPEEYAPSMADELAQTVGLPLTRHNAVWGPFALDKLRELQHVLMKHAFAQTAEKRQDVLDSVKVVEVAVVLRLRFEEAAQQELLLQQAPAESPANTNTSANHLSTA
jgi:hypothetical protein